jgi:hypothetical protein
MWGLPLVLYSHSSVRRLVSVVVQILRALSSRNLTRLPIWHASRGTEQGYTVTDEHSFKSCSQISTERPPLIYSYVRTRSFVSCITASSEGKAISAIYSSIYVTICSGCWWLSTWLVSHMAQRFTCWGHVADSWCPCVDRLLSSSYTLLIPLKTCVFPWTSCCHLFSSQITCVYICTVHWLRCSHRIEKNRTSIIF